MLICVDGSGPSGDAEYRHTFANSYVRQIALHSTQAVSKWYRGPDMFGEHQIAPADLVQVVLAHFDARTDDASGTPEPVFLAGYSRGAATVVDVAARLAREGVEVEAMFLFDAVDRSGHLGNTAIVGNTRHVFHARRNPDAESRLSFDNCATEVASPGEYLQGYFMTTHGGMGGVPFGVGGLLLGAREEYLDPRTDAARRSAIRREVLLVEADDAGGGIDALVGSMVSLGGEMIGGAATGDPTDGITNLTMAEEEAGSLQCARWMWRHLISQGVLPTGSSPHLGPVG